MVYIGLDIGSISINAVLITSDKIIECEIYKRTHGQPIETLLKILDEILSTTQPENISGIAVTGTGGTLAAEILKCFL